MPPRQPSRRDRDAFGPASPPSCLPCRHVAAFQTIRAHPSPLTRPRAPFKWLTASRKSTSEALPKKSAECRFCSGPGIRFAGYPARHRRRHSVERTPIFPSSRPADSSHNPEDGICRQETDAQYETTPVSSPQRGNPEGMLPHLAPGVSNAPLRLRRQRSTSNAWPPLSSPQQLGDGHSRTCTQTCITARQTDRMPLHILLVTPGSPSQPLTEQAAPGSTPA